MTSRAKIRCNQCDQWLTVEGHTENIDCDGCGSLFAVTI
jgi:Zn finger protein HypA/HybF involved in hydrogenase expression